MVLLGFRAGGMRALNLSVAPGSLPNLQYLLIFRRWRQLLTSTGHVKMLRITTAAIVSVRSNFDQVSQLRSTGMLRMLCKRAKGVMALSWPGIQLPLLVVYLRFLLLICGQACLREGNSTLCLLDCRILVTLLVGDIEGWSH